MAFKNYKDDERPMYQTFLQLDFIYDGLVPPETTSVNEGPGF